MYSRKVIKVKNSSKAKNDFSDNDGKWKGIDNKKRWSIRAQKVLSNCETVDRSKTLNDPIVGFSKINNDDIMKDYPLDD